MNFLSKGFKKKYIKKIKSFIFNVLFKIKNVRNILQKMTKIWIQLQNLIVKNKFSLLNFKKIDCKKKINSYIVSLI
jgi:hypothetical protein